MPPHFQKAKAVQLSLGLYCGHLSVTDRGPTAHEFYIECQCGAAWWSVIWHGTRDYRPLNYAATYQCLHRNRLAAISNPNRPRPA